MERGRVLSLLATVVAAVSLVYSANGGDWVAAGTSLVATVLSCVSAIRCGDRAAMFCITGSLLVLAGALVIGMALPYSLVEDGDL
ncbi:MAG: hypothetical protein IJ856_07555, partial [Candidatus Methanomethylophilaceae archaeon]|nr:hypothetical protein [Candidatus Methanomethylophilaceae archaeon]